ncbi:ced-6 [Pristionchus pacificus]|uniref:Ced-6 n=1 Tax=Pristionchus pacificus TaxID=54126 RepID=A0A2A6CQT4_PRIPA|nr:ced-6 [Pristionchus pacificus]|eukprot:PDM80480.1 ced-6 [Pristionchus pacificus]
MDTLKKIRRSISATNTVQTTVPSGKIERKQTWVHSPDVLLYGSVTYTLRLVGTKPVNKPKGTDVVREAIHAIHFQNENRRAETSRSDAKLQKVDLRINVEGVTIQDAKSKELLFRYPLKRISFCSDDKQDKRYLAFIANDGDSSKSTCLVFLSDKMSEEITRTIGEAFDLCYKKFMDNHKLDLQNQKEVLILRKRIAELEEENQRLSQLLADSTRSRHPDAPSTVHDSNSLSLLDTPDLPSTPMPIGPPPSLLSSLDVLDISSSAPNKQISPSGLLPPPSVLASGAPLYSIPLTSTTIAPPPPVPARRAQNSSQITPPASSTSIFDDTFDPRANSNGSSKQHKTKEEYDSMINAVDAELANLKTSSSKDFSFEVADGGDAFKDFEEDNEYGCPKNIVDPKNVQESKNIRPSFN